LTLRRQICHRPIDHDPLFSEDPLFHCLCHRADVHRHRCDAVDRRVQYRVHAFGESLELVIPTLLETFRDWLAGAAPEFVSDPLLVSLFALPTFAVFAVLALLLYALGRKPPEKGLKRRPR
jgi:hypothetical protein